MIHPPYTIFHPYLKTFLDSQNPNINWQSEQIMEGNID